MLPVDATWRDCQTAAAMQHVAEWLQKLGLDQYVQRFAENDINFAILPHLTDQDLRELGVKSLGHRRQLLLAIAEISGVQKETASSPSTPIAPTKLPSAAKSR
jgi:SAM domain (Sterile alpha motif)